MLTRSSSVGFISAVSDGATIKAHNIKKHISKIYASLLGHIEAGPTKGGFTDFAKQPWMKFQRHTGRRVNGKNPELDYKRKSSYIYCRHQKFFKHP